MPVAASAYQVALFNRSDRTAVLFSGRLFRLRWSGTAGNGIFIEALCEKLSDPAGVFMNIGWLARAWRKFGRYRLVTDFMEVLCFRSMCQRREGAGRDGLSGGGGPWAGSGRAGSTVLQG